MPRLPRTRGTIGNGSGCRKQARPRTCWPGGPANWLAVEVSNHGARRLYQRLGYRDWGQGIVIDHWEETDAAGAELKRNADPCHYLTKPIE